MQFDFTCLPKDGELRLGVHVLAVRAWLTEREGKPVKVTLSDVSKKRSSNQNSYYWSVLIPCVTEHMNAGRLAPNLPLSTDTVHLALRAAFIGTTETPLGVPVALSTTTLSTSEFADYVERIKAHFATEGLHIPSPNEMPESF